MAFTLANEIVLPASPETVWAAINDPAILAACMPGCETLEKTADGEFSAVVKLKVGPITARFKGTVRFVDVDPPTACRIIGEGQGGLAGFAKGGATVKLTAEGETTRLAYDVKADIGGKIAQLGSRLIDGVAKKLSDQFFIDFAKAVTAKQAAPAA